LGGRNSSKEKAMSNGPSHQYLHRFTIEQDKNRSEITDWCRDNIVDYWRPVSTYWLHIFIQQKRDAMLFKLVWHDRVKGYKEPEL
jgi:hypothetical protein